MKELIKILQVAVKKHGGTSPLTIGHLLNIVKMAEGIRIHEKEIAGIKEEKQHNQILEDISWGGQG